jgi:hypothetical protein
MLIMATKLGFEHCELRNEVAEAGNSLDEKDPGTMSMSNCGELSKEFCDTIRTLLTWQIERGRRRRNKGMW